MKKFVTPLLATMLVSTAAFAADTSSNTAASTTDNATNNTQTTTNTTATTTQDSGISLSGKAKVMPHASISTGDNTASTDIRTSTDVNNDATASGTARNNTEVSANNHSENRTRGKGHKYGHDKH